MTAVGERALRVLVVDDEAGVRDVASAMLEASGHQAETAADGAGALERLDAGTRFDVLVIDRTMPDMHGREVLEAVRERVPGQAVVIISGDLEDGPPLRCAHQLQKPFGLEALLDAVAAAADGAESPG